MSKILEIFSERHKKGQIYRNVPIKPDDNVHPLNYVYPDTEDSVTIVGKTDLVNFFIDLNFFSQYAQRSIIINGNNFTLKADLINNSIEIFKMKRKKSIKFNIDNNYSYREQHKSILNNNYENSCSYTEGSKLMLLFDKIKNFKK